MFFKKIFGKKKSKIWNPGDKIHAFQLITHTGAEFSYDSKTRSKLLIYFFPNAWSDTYSDHITTMEKYSNRCLRYNIIPLCVTTDTPAALKTWAKTLSLRKIRILSDFWPHGYLTNSFGLLNRQRGCPERAFVIIDDEMKIIYKEKLEHLDSFDIEKVFQVLSNQKENSK